MPATSARPLINPGAPETASARSRGEGGSKHGGLASWDRMPCHAEIFSRPHTREAPAAATGTGATSVRSPDESHMEFGYRVRLPPHQVDGIEQRHQRIDLGGAAGL